MLLGVDLPPSRLEQVHLHPPAGRTLPILPEEASHPARQSASPLAGALVVEEVVGMDGDAGLAEEGAGIVYPALRDVLGEGGFDEVVAVPPDTVDPQAQ